MADNEKTTESDEQQAPDPVQQLKTGAAPVWLYILIALALIIIYVVITMSGRF